MATFIDQREDEINEEEVASLDEIQEQPEQPQPEDDVPEKYQGKSREEIVKMHQEVEKLVGRQSSEVGELRNIVDNFVQTQLAKEQAHTSAAEPEVDFFEDPKAAVENAIANHPKIKEAETATQRLRMQEAMARLKAEHSDFAEILKNEDFGKWVTKSKFRTELLHKADREYNYDAADELLTSWKERQTVVDQAKQNETTSRKQSVKAASTGNTRGSGDSPSRKVYRRADIIKLMQTDPDRYMSLAEEIRHAYAEGRVR
jgi:hypothetical protein|tara:strand:+ start:604 stop:1380 length:777 start_codon:yes stop_codon:yes gene_type:complete